MPYKALLTLCVCTLSLLLSSGCSDEVDGNEDLSSIGGGGPIDDTPVGEVENSGFWVNVQSNQVDLFLDNTDSFDSDCFIDKDETEYIDMKCSLDIMEGDLYVHDLELQYNAPPGLCDYVITSPAWHWNSPVGIGPKEVEVDVDASGDEPFVSACVADHDGQGMQVNCSAHNELRDVGNVNGPRCVYDLTDSERPNCCFGNYTLTINTDDGANVSTSVTEIPWGRDYSSCLSPYISNGWETFTTNNIPTTKIQHVPRSTVTDISLGLNDSIELVSNSKTTRVGFSTWANHYEGNTISLPIQSPHYHEGFYDNSLSSNKPFMVEPVTDVSGTRLRSLGAFNFSHDNSAWTFTCTDSALEVKQRIKLYIREWNTLADFFLYQTSGGVTYNPDVTGEEGSACDYDIEFGQDCNDRYDIGDVLNDAGGDYDYSANPIFSEYYDFFPNRSYQ